MATNTRDYDKEYRERHKNSKCFRLTRLLWQAKHRAKVRNLKFSIILDDLLELYPTDNKCPILGIPIKFNSNGHGDRDNSPSIDRVNPAKGYERDNIRVISWKANRLKSDATINELQSILKYMKA